jgi:hypothetical protein
MSSISRILKKAGEDKAKREELSTAVLTACAEWFLKFPSYQIPSMYQAVWEVEEIQLYEAIEAWKACNPPEWPDTGQDTGPHISFKMPSRAQDRRSPKKDTKTGRGIL